jgi:hypothetical protein
MYSYLLAYKELYKWVQTLLKLWTFAIPWPRA